jgi:hypothetical protein
MAMRRLFRWSLEYNFYHAFLGRFVRYCAQTSPKKILYWEAPMYRPRFEKITALIDWILLLAALMAILFLALEDLGVNIPAIRNNLAQLAFVGICLLIISTIWERRMILTDINQKMDDFLEGRVNASMVLQRQGEEFLLMEHLENARSISFCGATLSTTIQQYRREFARLAKKGKKFRFLVVDPQVYQGDHEDKRYFNQGAMVEFAGLLAETPRGKIEVRLIGRYPSEKLIIIDGGGLSENQIVVEMYGYRDSKTNRPYFIVRQDHDPQWFTYFNQVFEAMWQDAAPYTGQDGIAATGSHDPGGAR